MSVLAVPRSIAMSVEKKSNIPIIPLNV